MKFIVINGPNINLLGIREKSIYGSNTYQDLVEMISVCAKKENIDIDFFQSNHEGEIIDCIHKAYFDKFDGIIINPAGYTHTSISILDALKAVSIPTIEVHISNIYEREDFRKKSLITPSCIASIVGKGFEGYLMAIKQMIKYIKENVK